MAGSEQQRPPNPDRQAFFTRLVALAGMVPNFTLTKEMVGMYDRMLRDLGYPALCLALERVMSERSSRDPFPSIKELRAVVQPTATAQDQAMLTADTIIQSVRRDGWTNPARARERMGEIGWAVVGGDGGYQALCHNLDGRNENSYRRQFAELARAYQTKGLPQAEEAPALPAPDQGGSEGRGLVGLGDLVKRIAQQAAEESGEDR